MSKYSVVSAEEVDKMLTFQIKEKMGEIQFQKYF